MALGSAHFICSSAHVPSCSSCDLKNVWQSDQGAICRAVCGRMKLGKRPSKSKSKAKAKAKAELPSMEDILRVGRTQNVELQLKSQGPLFRVMATSVVTGEEVGRANGFITIWFGAKGKGKKILHLESIRMTKQAFKMHNTSIFGMGLLVGAVAIRHGYDCNCETAELLAINDSHLYHSKLVRFYTRMGFKAVYEVKGSSLADIIHMLAWGGIGTRMDADIEELLIKWSHKFRPGI